MKDSNESSPYKTFTKFSIDKFNKELSKEQMSVQNNICHSTKSLNSTQTFDDQNQISHLGHLTVENMRRENLHEQPDKESQLSKQTKRTKVMIHKRKKTVSFQAQIESPVEIRTQIITGEQDQKESKSSTSSQKDGKKSSNDSDGRKQKEAPQPTIICENIEENDQPNKNILELLTQSEIN